MAVSVTGYTTTTVNFTTNQSGTQYRIVKNATSCAALDGTSVIGAGPFTTPPAGPHVINASALDVGVNNLRVCVSNVGATKWAAASLQITRDAILDHTYRSTVLWAVRVNGLELNEAGLNALVAGAAGTPVGLVTGDASTCAQCRALLPDVETVTVKWAMSRMAARSLHPERARAAIREGAARAVAAADRFRPFRLDPPFALEIDTIDTAMADAAAIMPGVERPGARTLRYMADDVQTLFRALLSIVRLGGTAY